MYQSRQHDEQPTGHEFLSGLLFGAAIGAAVGLLFAPRSGAEIRGQVADSASQVRRKAGRTYDRASSAVTAAVDSTRDAWQRGRESFDKTRDAVAREAAAVVDGHVS